jgi:aminopeptidase N
MLRIANCLFWCAIFPLGAATLSRPYTAENYDVSIHLDLAKQRLDGEAAIRFHGLADNAISALEFDAGALEITGVLEGQVPQSFERDRRLLIVVLTRPLRPDESRTITVKYSAGPAAGLRFFSDQVYSSVTSDWMPCNDRPGERATLHLTIAGPPGSMAAASGRATAAHDVDGQSISEWQLDSPTEPSWFGFAVGSFSESTSEANGVKLRVLGAGKEILEPTAAAMHYLAERTGKPYPGQTYTQVFVHGDTTRSMAAGLSLRAESQPENPGPLTNALAHQWYGVAIATKDWSDLWLSEGISTFLADAYLGQRFGKAKFEQEIARSREIHKQLAAAGKDRPLSGAEWTTHEEAAGEIPAHKGAWFLYLANQLMGDNAFWDALRLYTTSQWGQAATSEDLQRAFASTSRGNPKLDSLFDMWVYGIAPTNPKKSR